MRSAIFTFTSGFGSRARVAEVEEDLLELTAGRVRAHRTQGEAEERCLPARVPYLAGRGAAA